MIPFWEILGKYHLLLIYLTNHNATMFIEINIYVSSSLT